MSIQALHWRPRTTTAAATIAQATFLRVCHTQQNADYAEENNCNSYMAYR